MIQRIRERDGDGCLYCDQSFTDTNPAEMDHLDNNTDHNRLWNKVMSHRTCNNKKKFNFDMQCKADDKIISNKKAVSVRERTTESVTSSEQRKRNNKPIVLQWIAEHLMIDNHIPTHDGVCAIVNLCYSMNGTGSQSAVYRYIQEFTNSYDG